jgi:hypothetical protein
MSTIDSENISKPTPEAKPKVRRKPAKKAKATKKAPKAKKAAPGIAAKKRMAGAVMLRIIEPAK